jgi:hypothetical protein
MEKSILKVYLIIFSLGSFLVFAVGMPLFFAPRVVDSNSPVSNVSKSPMDADVH